MTGHIAIYRPSVGEWWINRSSTGATVAFQFGRNGDRPVAGDYDKDGKSDIAIGGLRSEPTLYWVAATIHSSQSHGGLMATCR